MTKQLKISDVIKRLKELKKEHGDAELWYHICGKKVGEDMPMQVEGIKVIERDWGDKYITIW